MKIKEIKALLLCITVIFMLISLGVIQFLVHTTYKTDEKGRFCSSLWLKYPKNKIKKIIIYPLSLNVEKRYSYCSTIDKIIVIDDKELILSISNMLNGEDSLYNYTSKIGVINRFNVLFIGEYQRYFIFNLRFLSGFSGERPFLMYDQYKNNDIFKKDVSLLYDLYEGYRVSKEIYPIFKSLFRQNNVNVIKYGEVPNYDLKDHIK
ncbi:hypothetical protein AAEX28_16115 [Lentisphaerota bacterium WC36G]|nr:hypothetical protein LJT99_02870 [Lentisphaerae bacterium WC36]